MTMLPTPGTDRARTGGKMDAVFASAVGIDVHAQSLVCCHEWFDFESQSSRREEARFGTSQSQLRAFQVWVKTRSPNQVVMESTGVLWVAPYEALEDAGFQTSQLVLANARDVKGKKGHKTDANDAAHLAELGRLDAVRGSFVPKREFREQRAIARQYIRAKQDFARMKNRKSKTLNQIGTRAGSVFSDINGKSAGIILRAWADNDPNLDQIVESKSKILKHSADEILDALAPLNENEQQLLKIQEKQIAESEKACSALMSLLRVTQEPYEDIVQRFMTIPGVKETAARMILAEIGDDLSSFPSIRHFTSWAGICPGVKESAGKSLKGSRSLKGNRWLKSILVEVASGISLMKKGYLREVFQKFNERRGRNRAIIALAHKLLRIIYTLIKSGTSYVEKHVAVMKKFRAKRLARALRQAEHMNLTFEGGSVCDRTSGEVLAR